VGGIKLNAGKLRNYVEIQAPILDTDGVLLTADGEDGYETVCHAYCSIQSSASMDAHYQDIQITQSSHVIRMRYIDGITGQYRIKWGTRKFNIVGTPNNIEEGNVELVISANEVK
jgi:head-tail adaptor